MRIENNPDYERSTIADGVGGGLARIDSESTVELIDGTAMSFGAGVEALGQETGKILYQWQIEGSIEEGFRDISAADARFSGIDTAKLLVPKVTGDLDGAALRCLVAAAGSTVRSQTRVIRLSVKPSVEAGEVTAVQESVQDWARRRQDEQRRERLRNYGK